MLSDKVPDRGQTIPPQERPPRDPLRIYGFLGGVVGIVLICLLRNVFHWPDIVSPMLSGAVRRHLGISIGLQDLALGSILGSSVAVYFGRRVQEREEQRRFREYRDRNKHN